MIVGSKQIEGWLRNAGLRMLAFALLSIPAMSFAITPSAKQQVVETSGTQFTINSKLFSVTGVNKSIDPNHLIASGNANVFEKLSDLTTPPLEFGTWHSYPLYYKLTVGSSTP